MIWYPVKLEHSFSAASALGSLNLLSHVCMLEGIRNYVEELQGKPHLQDDFRNRPLVLQLTDKFEDMHCLGHTEGLHCTFIVLCY